MKYSRTWQLYVRLLSFRVLLFKFVSTDWLSAILIYSNSVYILAGLQQYAVTHDANRCKVCLLCCRKMKQIAFSSHNYWNESHLFGKKILIDFLASVCDLIFPISRFSEFVKFWECVVIIMVNCKTIMALTWKACISYNNCWH